MGRGDIPGLISQTLRIGFDVDQVAARKLYARVLSSRRIVNDETRCRGRGGLPW